MWLLNVSTRRLEKFHGSNVPRYAILSHRWEDEEVTFDQMMLQPHGKSRAYSKISRCCEMTIRWKLQYVWIDTCCIDKKSSAELSEAINSMYRWYEEAVICFAYLYDVEAFDVIARSSWFTRAWTLQELLAPKNVLFFDHEWKQIARRGDPLNSDNSKVISDITRIPQSALRHFLHKDHSVAERMSWAAGRFATRDEDVAYSLLGIFEINMPMLYGEGKRAYQRLQQEIIAVSNDLSILAWAGASKEWTNPLAESPNCFEPCEKLPLSQGFTINNAGLSVRLYIQPLAMGFYRAYLKECKRIATVQEWRSSGWLQSFKSITTMLLWRNSDEGTFTRVVGIHSPTLYLAKPSDLTAIRSARSCDLRIVRNPVGPPIRPHNLEPVTFTMVADETSYLVAGQDSSDSRSQTRPLTQYIPSTVSFPPGKTFGYAGCIILDQRTKLIPHVFFGCDFYFHPYVLIQFRPRDSVPSTDDPTFTVPEQILSLIESMDNDIENEVTGSRNRTVGEGADGIYTYRGSNIKPSDYILPGIRIYIYVKASGFKIEVKVH